jgi:eukaryotic-like serine/threonine-protein kinase
MLPEDRLLGHYRLVRRIGSGGMGEVYLAEDTRINRQVAIKVVRTETEAYPDPVTAQETVRLFQREMRAITTLDHPHILPLFDFGEEKDGNMILTYMVMPYRQEGSLADWLQQRGTAQRLTPNEVFHFIMQAADALQHAHDHHFIHQDVKLPNFLVRSRPGNMLPDLLLMDFGIAKITTATAIASRNIRGTPSYMAPEQWEGRPQPATDQYALAIMAYLLLTGRTPFVGGMEQVMRQHSMVPPQPPSSFNSAIPPTLDAVILRALEKQPARRFSSILAFAQAFRQALQSISDQDPTFITPPPNPPVGSAYDYARGCSRNDPDLVEAQACPHP